MKNNCYTCAKWHTVCDSDTVGICERNATSSYLLKVAHRTLKTDELLPIIEDMLTGCDDMCMFWAGCKCDM